MFAISSIFCFYSLQVHSKHDAHHALRQQPLHGAVPQLHALAQLCVPLRFFFCICFACVVRAGCCCCCCGCFCCCCCCRCLVAAAAAVAVVVACCHLRHQNRDANAKMSKCQNAKTSKRQNANTPICQYAKYMLGTLGTLDNLWHVLLAQMWDWGGTALTADACPGQLGCVIAAPRACVRACTRA